MCTINRLKNLSEKDISMHTSPKLIQIIFIMTLQIYMPNYGTWRIDTLLYKQKQYQWDKNTPKISCGQIGIQMRDRESFRREKWFNIGAIGPYGPDTLLSSLWKQICTMYLGNEIWLNETRFYPKKKSSQTCLGPKNIDTILMHWMSLKSADNFQIREHSWSRLFHINV